MNLNNQRALEECERNIRRLCANLYDCEDCQDCTEAEVKKFNDELHQWLDRRDQLRKQ